MGNFNRGGSRFGDRDSGRSDDRGGRGFSRGGFGGSRGGSSYGRGGRDEDRQMFQAVCSDCGKDCEVPFRPTGTKPVLCRDCFRGSNDAPRPNGRSFGRSDHGDRGDRSEQGGNHSGVSQQHFDQQWNLLNEKLDKILKRVTPSHLRSKQDEVTDEPEAEPAITETVD